MARNGTNGKCTGARPGSHAKISELGRRLRAGERTGESIFRRGDAPEVVGARAESWLLVVRLRASSRYDAVGEAIQILRGLLSPRTWKGQAAPHPVLPDGVSVEWE